MIAITNGRVLTITQGVIEEGTVLVEGGRIVAVGAWEDVAPQAEGLSALDLTGKTVLPGLIDTHAHFLWTALSLAALDVSSANDHPSLQAIIRQAVAAGFDPAEVRF